MSATHTDTPRSRWPWTLVWLAALVALNSALVVSLLYVVPRFKKTFDEFNLQLPGPTKLLLQVSDFYTKFWYALAPLQQLLVVGGVIVGRHLFRTPRPGNVFAAVCLFVLVALLVWVCYGLGHPNLKLLEGPSR